MNNNNEETTQTITDFPVFDENRTVSVPSEVWYN